MISGYSNRVVWEMEHTDGTVVPFENICFGSLLRYNRWKERKSITYICPDLTSTREGGYETSDKFLTLASKSGLYSQDKNKVLIEANRTSRKEKCGGPIIQDIHCTFSLEGIGYYQFLVMVSPLRLLQELPPQVVDIVDISERYPHLSFLECYFISMFCGTEFTTVPPSLLEMQGGYGLLVAHSFRAPGHALMTPYIVKKITKFNEREYLENLDKLSNPENHYSPIHDYFLKHSEIITRTPTSRLYDLDTTPLSRMYGDKDE